MSNVIMHFEIPADDVARAKAFYERTFGWKIKAFPMPPGQEYFGVTAMKKGEPGINGGLMRRREAGQPFMNYVTVKSIEAITRAIQANGGTIALPKQEIGQGMGWISAFIDPENNLIGLHQVAATASPKPGARKAAAKRAAKTATRRKPATRASGSKKRRG